MKLITYKCRVHGEIKKSRVGGFTSGKHYHINCFQNVQVIANSVPDEVRDKPLVNSLARQLHTITHNQQESFEECRNMFCIRARQSLEGYKSAGGGG